ncbi:MAG: hypothetical protein WCO56_00930 [Verrucomicrobiota bacterium]
MPDSLDAHNPPGGRPVSKAPAGLPHELFSEGDLADFLLDRWKLASAELHAARLAGTTNKEKLNDTAIIDRYRLATPSLLTGFKIIKHGWEETPSADLAPSRPGPQEDFDSHEDFLQAQIDYLEARLKRASLRRSYIIVSIPFEGDGDLLRFRPPECPGVPPQGVVSGPAIQMKFERAEPEDAAWKDAFREDLQMIDRFLTATRAAVHGFNLQLASL